MALNGFRSGNVRTCMTPDADVCPLALAVTASVSLRMLRSFAKPGAAPSVVEVIGGGREVEGGRDGTKRARGYRLRGGGGCTQKEVIVG